MHMMGMHGMNPMMMMMMSNPMMMQQMMHNPMLMGYMMANMMKHQQPMQGQAQPHQMYGNPSVHPMHSHGHIAANGGVGGMQNMAKLGSKINPMFNVNMGYMMGRAVKKCQPLKNGLEICAMYNPMTNQLNVDV